MDDYFAYFLRKFAPQSDVRQPTPAEVEAYRGILPDQLLGYWTEAGWCACADGLLWIVNPQDYEATVQQWLAGTKLPHDDSYQVIARSAFGRLLLWGKQTGQAVTIDPLYAQIIVSPPDKFLQQGREAFAIGSAFAAFSSSAFDIDDIHDKPLFKRALKKLGKLNADEMYGFEPALVLGGSPELGKLARVKIFEHLSILRQFGEVEMLHIDVSKDV